ncbi:hypothetical protein TZ694_002391 [Escherichia coli]|nr:hypothetical protein [Escherichia coli]
MRTFVSKVVKFPYKFVQFGTHTIVHRELSFNGKIHIDIFAKPAEEIPVTRGANNPSLKGLFDQKVSTKIDTNVILGPNDSQYSIGLMRC